MNQYNQHILENCAVHDYHILQAREIRKRLRLKLNFNFPYEEVTPQIADRIEREFEKFRDIENDLIEEEFLGISAVHEREYLQNLRKFKRFLEELFIVFLGGPETDAIVEFLTDLKPIEKCTMSIIMADQLRLDLIDGFNLNYFEPSEAEQAVIDRVLEMRLNNLA